MTAPMMCNQEGCDAAASHRFTWPGRDEAGVCAPHVDKLRAVARAMSLHLQLLPIGGPGCARCDGCGLVADSDDGEPWTAWAELEPPSNLAVQIGSVNPIPCPGCA